VGAIFIAINLIPAIFLFNIPLTFKELKSPVQDVALLNFEADSLPADYADRATSFTGLFVVPSCLDNFAD
jgi:hypothetical protein